ncbi:MAG: radical SAM protein [Eubacteriales bacterium]|nr:radical SAM protein [Eubacteriales bacterium]
MNQSIQEVPMEFDVRQCRLCPRQCRCDRRAGQGYCRGGDSMRIARAALHLWEEPCISGESGSGTIFFTGCTLGCCFCQNYPISHGQIAGTPVDEARFAKLCLSLQRQGAHNINLVNPTHYIPWIADGLRRARQAGLTVPVVYNTGGYDKSQSLAALAGLVDVWLPDLKFFDAALSRRYAAAADYFTHAAAAVVSMRRMAGPPVFDAAGRLVSGVLVRHLVMPGARHDSMKLLEWLYDTFGRDGVAVSVMSQYTPCYGAREYPQINRRVTRMEYESVADFALQKGFVWLYGQQRESATLDYTPDFTGPLPE